MAQDAIGQMKADAKLTERLAAARTPEELSQILHESMEDAHIANRNPYTGRFERTEQAAPTAEEIAAKTAAKVAADAAEPKTFQKTVQIGGQDFEFTADSARSLDLQVSSARAVAAQLTQEAPAIQRNLAHEVFRANELAEQFRAGVISPADYLRESGVLQAAVDTRLAEAGFDVNKAAAEQFQQSWVAAAQEFVQTEVGRDWPGGEKNKELLALKIAELGLVNASDKVVACTQAFEALKAKGMLFDGDVSQEQLEAMTKDMTPQEIVEHWRQAQDISGGDASKANDVFIETFQNGRSSGLFGR